MVEFLKRNPDSYIKLSYLNQLYSGFGSDNYLAKHKFLLKNDQIYLFVFNKYVRIYENWKSHFAYRTIMFDRKKLKLPELHFKSNHYVSIMNGYLHKHWWQDFNPPQIFDKNNHGSQFFNRLIKDNSEIVKLIISDLDIPENISYAYLSNTFNLYVKNIDIKVKYSLSEDKPRYFFETSDKKDKEKKLNDKIGKVLLDNQLVDLINKIDLNIKNNWEQIKIITEQKSKNLKINRTVYLHTIEQINQFFFDWYKNPGLFKYPKNIQFILVPSKGKIINLHTRLLRSTSRWGFYLNVSMYQYSEKDKSWDFFGNDRLDVEKLEIDKTLRKRNIDKRNKYYAINILSEYLLNNGLINIYPESRDILINDYLDISQQKNVNPFWIFFRSSQIERDRISRNYIKEIFITKEYQKLYKSYKKGNKKILNLPGNIEPETNHNFFRFITTYFHNIWIKNNKEQLNKYKKEFSNIKVWEKFVTHLKNFVLVYLEHTYYPNLQEISEKINNYSKISLEEVLDSEGRVAYDQLMDDYKKKKNKEFQRKIKEFYSDNKISENIFKIVKEL